MSLAVVEKLLESWVLLHIGSVGLQFHSQKKLSILGRRRNFSSQGLFGLAAAGKAGVELDDVPESRGNVNAEAKHVGNAPSLGFLQPVPRAEVVTGAVVEQ